MTQLDCWEPNFSKPKHFRLCFRMVPRPSGFSLGSEKISEIFFLALGVGNDQTRWLGDEFFKIEAFSLAFYGGRETERFFAR